jgi:hypothetical protein
VQQLHEGACFVAQCSVQLQRHLSSTSPRPSVLVQQPISESESSARSERMLLPSLATRHLPKPYRQPALNLARIARTHPSQPLSLSMLPITLSLSLLNYVFWVVSRPFPETTTAVLAVQVRVGDALAAGGEWPAHQWHHHHRQATVRLPGHHDGHEQALVPHYRDESSPGHNGTFIFTSLVIIILTFLPSQRFIRARLKAGEWGAYASSSSPVQISRHSQFGFPTLWSCPLFRHL